MTDDKGDFVLNDIPAGSYTLMVWHEGWTVAKTDKDSEGKITHYTFDAPKETRKSITVSSGGEVALQFALSDEGLTELE